MKLGQALAAARQKNQWSQAEAAEQIGVDAATVSRWESGHAVPSAYNMRRISTAYGIMLTEWEYAHQEQATIHLSQEEMLGLPPFSEASLAMRLHSLAFVSCSYPHRAELLRQALEEYDAMSSEYDETQMSRRSALMGLATLPLAALGLQGTSMRKPAPHLIEETLNQCEAGILACEQLGKGKHEEMQVAFSSLSAYVSVLKMVVDESAIYRQRAAGLASQSYFVLGKLSPHVGLPSSEKMYFSQAVVYAQESGDPELQLTALWQLAWTYLEDKQLKTALTTIQQAQSLVVRKHAPINASIRSIISSSFAAIQAKNHSTFDPSLLARADDLMQQSLVQPNQIQKYRYDQFVMNEGVTYSYQGQWKQAVSAYTKVFDPINLTIDSDLPMRTKIEWFYLYIMAALKDAPRDMEHIMHIWQAGIKGAVELQSQKRFEEMSLAYEVMEGIWPNEARVKELRDLVVHW